MHRTVVAAIVTIGLLASSTANGSTVLVSAPGGSQVLVYPPNSLNLPPMIATFTPLAAQPPYAGFNVFPGPVQLGTTAAQLPSTTGNYLDLYYVGPPQTSGFIVGAHLTETMFGNLGTVTGASNFPPDPHASASSRFIVPPPLGTFDVTFNVLFESMAPNVNFYAVVTGNQAPQNGSAYDILCVMNATGPNIVIDPTKPLLRMHIDSIVTPLNVPEPASWLLAVVGIAIAIIARRRSRS